MLHSESVWKSLISESESGSWCCAAKRDIKRGAFFSLLLSYCGGRPMGFCSDLICLVARARWTEVDSLAWIGYRILVGKQLRTVSGDPYLYDYRLFCVFGL